VGWLIDPFQLEFMRTALLGAVLVSVSCASVGVYVVLRRMAFLGNAMAHTVLPGVVVAILTGASVLIGGLIAAIVTAVAIAVAAHRETVREDTAIGVVFSAMFALGILVISTQRSFRDLSHVLFGNVLGIDDADLVALAVIAVIAVALLAVFHKELELTTVDPVHAAAIGLSPEWIRIGLLLLLAPVVVAGIQAVGIVMLSALLVTPAATAGLLTQRLVPMMALSVGVGVLSSFLGLLISYHFDASAGAAIVLVASACFAAAWTVDRVRSAAASRGAPAIESAGAAGAGSAG
jgi:ABC-type Mn2+/Zn2+ transport system permease subunit